jgi:hypothetical protein
MGGTADGFRADYSAFKRFLEKANRCLTKAIEALFLSQIQSEDCWAPSSA